MIERTESASVARPTSEVWKLVGEPASWPLWANEVGDVSVEGELRAGAAVSYTYRGRPVTATISDCESGRLLAIASSRSSYDVRESIELADDRGATEVSIAIVFEPRRWWGRVLAVLLTPFSCLLLGRPLRRSLSSLRRAAEQA